MFQYLTKCKVVNINLKFLDFRVDLKVFKGYNLINN